MFYGEGYASADDVVGHEMTHGVISHNSDLFYWGQSGAINESLADIMGEIVDHRHPSPGDSPHSWALGEDLPIGAVRNMKDPGRFGQPDTMTSRRYARGEADNGGVHTNSGVGNRTFYLISQGGKQGGADRPGHRRALAEEVRDALPRRDPAPGVRQRLRRPRRRARPQLSRPGPPPPGRDDQGRLPQRPPGHAGDAAAHHAATGEAAARRAADLPAGRRPGAGAVRLREGRAGEQVRRGVHLAACPAPVAVGVPAVPANATSGRRSWFSIEPQDTTVSSLTMHPVALPAGRPAYLWFQQWRLLESGTIVGGTPINYDAGTVEVGRRDAWPSRPRPPRGCRGSTDRDDVITDQFGNPSAGRVGFSRDSRGYVASRLTLKRYAGHAVSPQFTMNTDNDSTEQGWYLDDIRVYTCGRAPVPRSTPRISGAATVGARLTATTGRWSPSAREGAGPVVRRRSADRRRHRLDVRRPGRRPREADLRAGHRDLPGPARVDLLGGDGSGGQRVGEPRRRRRRLVEQPAVADRGESPPETLPGLRETVRAARPKRAAKARGPPRRSTRSPTCSSRRRWPTSTGRSTTPCRPRWRTSAVPGARVKVRFAGKDLDGFVVARSAHTDHTGTLTPLRRVVSAEPVLRPAVAELAGLLAERYAGTRADVLRLAVPPRHATTEKQPSPPEEPVRRRPGRGARRVARLPGGGGVPRPTWPAAARPAAVWSALPGEDWPRLLAQAAAATLAGGRGSVLCVPDHRDVARLDAALTDVLGAGHHVVLTAGAGPARRYREFLAVSRGTRRIVVGTRAAAFAPVHDLGLVAIWDDGDDLHAEPRAPYPHAREVLLTRATVEGAAALVGGFARSVEAEQLLATGWAHELAAPREALRAAVTVSVVGRHRPRARARPAGAGRRGCPSRCTHAVVGRAGARAGARPHAPPRVRRVAGLRALPYAGPLRRLHRPAGRVRPDRPARLPLVRHRRRRLGLLGLRRPRAARPGGR